MKSLIYFTPLSQGLPDVDVMPYNRVSFDIQSSTEGTSLLTLLPNKIIKDNRPICRTRSTRLVRDNNLNHMKMRCAELCVEDENCDVVVSYRTPEDAEGERSFSNFSVTCVHYYCNDDGELQDLLDAAEDPDYEHADLQVVKRQNGLGLASREQLEYAKIPLSNDTKVLLANGPLVVNSDGVGNYSIHDEQVVDKVYIAKLGATSSAIPDNEKVYPAFDEMFAFAGSQDEPGTLENYRPVTCSEMKSFYSYFSGLKSVVGEQIALADGYVKYVDCPSHDQSCNQDKIEIICSTEQSNYIVTEASKECWPKLSSTASADDQKIPDNRDPNAGDWQECKEKCITTDDCYHFKVEIWKDDFSGNWTKTCYYTTSQKALNLEKYGNVCETDDKVRDYAGYTQFVGGKYIRKTKTLYRKGGPKSVALQKEKPEGMELMSKDYFNQRLLIETMNQHDVDCVNLANNQRAEKYVEELQYNHGTCKDISKGDVRAYISKGVDFDLRYNLKIPFYFADHLSLRSMCVEDFEEDYCTGTLNDDSSLCNGNLWNGIMYKDFLTYEDVNGNYKPGDLHGAISHSICAITDGTCAIGWFTDKAIAPGKVCTDRLDFGYFTNKSKEVEQIEANGWKQREGYDLVKSKFVPFFSWITAPQNFKSGGVYQRCLLNASDDYDDWIAQKYIDFGKALKVGAGSRYSSECDCYYNARLNKKASELNNSKSPKFYERTELRF